MSSLKDCVDALCRALKQAVARVETLELKPSFKSKIINNNDGTYTHSDGAGVSGVIDLRPSDDGCNALSLGVDHRLFSEDFGYRVARTWQEVINLIAAGEDVLICQELQLDQDTVLDSDRRIRFVRDGAIDLNGFDLTLNVMVLNPNDRWIFKGVVIDETYPARWDGTGSNLIGHFGHSSIRYPSWFGAVANDDAFNALLPEREQNNHAIAAAMLSVADAFTGSIDPMVIQLRQGGYAIHRTVRLDGRKVTLRGHGNGGAMLAGTSLVAHSTGNVVPFDTSHFITTFKFPDGTTPVVELGYEYINDILHRDVGMQCGMENITIRCPQVQQDKPISGIMVEYGLQEICKFSQFSVNSYSGYGVGNPEEQHLGHNEGAGNFVFPQLNSVVFEEFYILDPAPFALDAIGMSIFGLNFTIRNGTISHHNGATVQRTAPPMYIGTRQSAIIEGLHIESFPSPTALYEGACIAIEDFAPGNVNVGAIDFRGTDFKSPSSSLVCKGNCAARSIISLSHNGMRASRE